MSCFVTMSQKGGINTLFAEITELTPLCRLRDCTQAHEPGCAVQAAAAISTLSRSPRTLARLHAENRDRTP